MDKQTKKYLIVGIAAVAIVYLLVTYAPNINFEGFFSGVGSGGTGDGDSYYYYTNPTPTPDGSTPAILSSLYVTIEPNPVDMGNWVYGDVVGEVAHYPVTVHAKHVGEGSEVSFKALLDEDGEFSHSQTMDIPGYWDFWVTTTEVTSNKPRLQVTGAMLTSNRLFCSRLMDTMDVSFDLFCHSAGSATVFVNDGSSSTPIGTVYVNSGGHGSLDYDFAAWSLGTYEVDFVVNGIKASDYGESVFITLAR